MKRLFIFAIAIASITFAGCNESGCDTRSRENQTPPKYLPGDFAVTKFQDTIVIVDTIACSLSDKFNGQYKVKTRKDSSYTFITEAELKEKI